MNNGRPIEGREGGDLALRLHKTIQAADEQAARYQGTIDRQKGLIDKQKDRILELEAEVRELRKAQQ